MELTTNLKLKEANEERFNYLIHKKNKNVCNSPIGLYKNFIKCFFVKKNILNKDYLNFNSKRPKSEKNSSAKSYSKKLKNKKNNFTSRKTYYRNPKINTSLKPKISIIQKIKTCNFKSPKKSKNNKIIKTMNKKEKCLMNTFRNINNNKIITKVPNKNNTHKINENNNITSKKIIKINNSRKSEYKKLICLPSRICVSLDSIISKNTINKNKMKINTNSYDKNKKITINKSPKINLKYMEKKLNTEIIKKNKKYLKVKYDQTKKENVNLKKTKQNCKYNKIENKTVNSNKRNKRNINSKKYDSNNNSKLLSENGSTNYKSIKSKKKLKFNKNNIYSTPNNNIRNKKNVKFIKNVNDNTYKMFEFIKENDMEEKINVIKINNFDLNKPKDENLKFTFVKDDKQSDLSVSRASKVMIGKIEGYKDIIEIDQKKNLYKLYNKKLNELNIINHSINSNKNCNKKINDCSYILKEENESITFNDDEFYENFYLDNIWEEASSTNTNNKIIGIKTDKNNYNYDNDSYYFKIPKKLGNNFINSENEKNISKKGVYNLKGITKDECDKKKKTVKKSDNCIII